MENSSHTQTLGLGFWSFGNLLSWVRSKRKVLRWVRQRQEWEQWLLEVSQDVGGREWVPETEPAGACLGQPVFRGEEGLGFGEATLPKSKGKILACTWIW